MGKKKSHKKQQVAQANPLTVKEPEIQKIEDQPEVKSEPAPEVSSRSDRRKTWVKSQVI